VTTYPESPIGAFSIAEVRVSGRTGVRPRGFVLRSYCDNDDARRELAERWGYPTVAGDVKLDVRHDRVVARVNAGGKPVLECELLDRDMISGGDIQYIASMHLARNKDDGKLVLVQVDPEFTFAKAERGKPTLSLISCNTEPLEGVGQPKEKPEVDLKYQAWIREMPCLVPGCPNESQFHHQNRQGHGAKGALCSDYRGLPLCCWHHTLGGTPGKPGSYHGTAKLTSWTFWKVYGVDVEATIHRLNTIWLEMGNKFK